MFGTDCAGNGFAPGFNPLTCTVSSVTLPGGGWWRIRSSRRQPISTQKTAQAKSTRAMPDDFMAAQPALPRSFPAAELDMTPEFGRLFFAAVAVPHSTGLAAPHQSSARPSQSEMSMADPADRLAASAGEWPASNQI